MIEQTSGQYSATCGKCDWVRGSTSVKPVAEAWVQMHDCEEDTDTVYDVLGLNHK